MSSEPLVFRSARALSAELASRALSAVELMRAFLAQIERVNGAVNAIVTLRPAGASRRSRRRLAPASR